MTGEPEVPNTEPEAPKGLESAMQALNLGGSLGRTMNSGLSGEAVTARGIMSAIGGVRGIVESLLPGMLFLVTFVFTQDARLSAVAPATLAIVAVVYRLAKREPLASALSGALAVGVCVAATMLTGKGEDYFLPGFWINAAWILALTISLVARWPLLGIVMGALRGSLTQWRTDPLLSRSAYLASGLWLLMFVLRLAVQLPLYFAGAVEALGVARLVMGVPLFALVVLFTWLLLSQTSLSSDEAVANTGDDAPER